MLGILFRCIALFPLLTAAYPQGFNVQGEKARSVTNVDAAKSFVSVDGRFAIALPEMISGFYDISSNTSIGRIPGVSYSWRMAEGTYTVSLLDRPDDTGNVERFFDGVRDGILSQLKSANATLAKEEGLHLGKIPGRQLRIEALSN